MTHNCEPTDQALTPDQVLERLRHALSQSREVEDLEIAHGNQQNACMQVGEQRGLTFAISYVERLR